MRPRAFVIMPFGKKEPDGFKRQEGPAQSIRTIDFDRIYAELFEPALHQAGYEAAKADSEAAAGDIRTECSSSRSPRTSSLRTSASGTRTSTTNWA